MDNQTTTTTITSATETVPVFTFRPNVQPVNFSTPSSISSLPTCIPAYTFRPKTLNSPLLPVPSALQCEPAYTFRPNILNRISTTITPTSTISPSLFGYVPPPTPRYSLQLRRQILCPSIRIIQTQCKNRLHIEISRQQFGPIFIQRPRHCHQRHRHSDRCHSRSII